MGLRFEIETKADVLLVRLRGSMDSAACAPVWRGLLEAVESTTAKSARVDASGVAYIDGFGAALLLDLQRRAIARQKPLLIDGLSKGGAEMLGAFDPAHFAAAAAPPRRSAGFLSEVGDTTLRVLGDLSGFMEFIGELARGLWHAALNPRSVRWKDTLRTAVVAGFDAIPVVCLVGFLIGFVMAFQSAIPMRQFGADIFVPTLVGLAILRELGPIMTAVVLAGRSGAAFAAEIGTMKVGEEVSALVTMGLAPVRFLVVPRVIAAVLVTPVLTLFANAAGLMGGLAVFMAIGYPARMYFDQLAQTISMGDFLSGLAKGFAFGLIVAGVGCLRGIQTGTGASAVGRSTTSAVVTSIVLVAIGDGIFSVIYYALGI